MLKRSTSVEEAQPTGGVNVIVVIKLSSKVSVYALAALGVLKAADVCIKNVQERYISIA